MIFRLCQSDVSTFSSTGGSKSRCVGSHYFAASSSAGKIMKAFGFRFGFGFCLFDAN